MGKAERSVLRSIGPSGDSTIGGACKVIQRIFAIASKLYAGRKPVRDSKYLAWVRSWPCIACGTVRRAREAMHIGPHGMGQKASDLDTLPGCRVCHRELHKLGPMRFQVLHGLDFAEAIATLQDLYVKETGRLPGEERRAA